MTMLPVPPDGSRPALDDPATAEAFQAYRQRALRMTFGGLAALVAGLILIGTCLTVGLQALGGLMSSAAPVVIGFGLGKWRRAKRVRAVLETEPWVSRSASFHVATSTGPALVIRADAHGPEAVCAPMQNKFKLVLEPGDGPVWVAGDPSRWAVVAPADRHAFVVATRPVLRLSEARLRRAATTEPKPSPLLRPDDTRPMWRRLAATPFGWLMIAMFVLFFGVFLDVATTSSMARGVTLRMGVIWLVGSFATRWHMRRAGRRSTEVDVDETQRRAARFVLTLPMAVFGLALTAAGLTSLVLQH